MQRTDINQEKRIHKQIGIKWKMLAILLGFVFLFALSMWVFQIRMLNFFYQSTKYKEMEKTSDALCEELIDRADVYGVAHNYSSQYYNDIWVYEIKDDGIEHSRPIVFADGTREELGPFLENEFNDLYLKSLQNGGKYIAVVPMKNFKESYFEFKIIDDNMDSPKSYPLVEKKIGNASVFFLNIFISEQGSFLIIQRSNIMPMATVVNALENQVLFIGIFVILFSLILATILSKFITKPIVKINNNAKILSDGEYNIEFSGHGYREIEELSDTLNYLASELSKNERLQKELISNISHDLRTPLTMIKGYSEVMRDIPGENTPENVQVIIDETARLTELVNDMFDLSKIQSGTRKTEMCTFCLTDVIRSTMFRYEKLTMQEGYKIEFSSNEEIYVYADKGMILQAVYNLINNAINYSGEDKYVLVRQDVIEDSVRISVVDNGDGILAQDIPFIWDRYYKVDKLHKRTTIGTGLGLSIVKSVLELHNATYGVESIPGKGSTFWFELKIATEEKK